MIPKSVLMGLAALPATQAFFLVPCWPLSTQRLDPLVYPGVVATHMHDIVGGSAFSPVMDYNTTQTSHCTTCMVNDDNSNYWMPALFHQDGDTYTPVPQHGSASMYYLNEKERLGAGEEMLALPVGLRMLAGDPDKRSGSQAFEDQAINYKCLNYKGTPTDSKGFPDQSCPDGLRAEVTFPSCWDGENLDSADHKSHMAYPTVTFEAGACPPTHPKHLVVVKMEVIFATMDKPFNGKNPFVWATGDDTGFSLHADLVMGWNHETLTAAVAQCDNVSGRIEDCPPFAGKIPAEKQWLDPGTCRIDSWVDEDHDAAAPLPKLPGCNPITSGPGRASKQVCNDNVKLLGAWADYTPPTSGGMSGAPAGPAAPPAGPAAPPAGPAAPPAGPAAPPAGPAAPPAGSATPPAGYPAPPAPNAGNQWGQPAAPVAPSAAPIQFYEKPADQAKPADAAPPAAAPAVPQAAPPAAHVPKIATEWTYVTVTTTAYGHAPVAEQTAAPPAPAPPAVATPDHPYWGDAAKREEHIHRHIHRRGNF